MNIINLHNKSPPQNNSPSKKYVLFEKIIITYDNKGNVYEIYIFIRNTIYLGLILTKK